MASELTYAELTNTLSADAVADMARAEQYRAALQAEVAASDYDWSGFSL
jgi:hypothetical protein